MTVLSGCNISRLNRSKRPILRSWCCIFILSLQWHAEALENGGGGDRVRKLATKSFDGTKM